MGVLRIDLRRVRPIANPPFGLEKRLPLADFTTSYGMSPYPLRQDVPISGQAREPGLDCWGMPTQGHEQTRASLASMSEAGCALIASRLARAEAGNECVLDRVMAGPSTG